MNMSPSAAEVVSGWANFFLLVSLIGGVVSTFFIVVSGNVKETHFKREMALAGERISSAEARAAEANRMAEEERLARIKIEARLAPRSLTQEQQRFLTERLRRLEKQTGTVMAAPSLPEGELFARALTAPLRAAGWNITVVNGPGTATILYPNGVVIAWRIEQGSLVTDPSGPREAAEGLALALKEAGIDATTIPSAMEVPNTVQIIITPK